ncbi:hypothetical protein [Kutzneria buriramensis]|uniref:HTH luxR-type domain-containing protein n=1 Tax=Kutzneria buriramensis TaxID=1045776 RepID=A0A3E0H5J6_9PSEU|nr:hypothetical protein [Kutzneria buriramensis]REH38104.1 hypothetical protein BCF44_114129 [Kutzneria buriramensis]
MTAMQSAHAIDEETLNLYRLTLRYDTLDSELVAREADIPQDRAADALARLHAARLIQPVGAGGHFRPTSPEWAEAELLTPVLAELYAKQRFIEETRKTLQGLGTVYREARGNAPLSEDFTFLPPGESVPAACYRLIQECSSEFAATHLSTTAVGDVLPGELEMARRGIGVRTLVQHSALSKLTVQSYVNKLTGAGGEVRALPQLWFRMAIFDRRAVLVSACPGDEPAAGAVLVRNPMVVTRVHEMFEHLWGTATSDMDSDGGRGELASSQLRSAVAQMLASGCTDEVSARRLGMSLRTYRRHVAALMVELGARTRFQAGLMVRDAGLLA